VFMFGVLGSDNDAAAATSNQFGGFSLASATRSRQQWASQHSSALAAKPAGRRKH
jgi:hypothetical protein